MSLVKSLNEMAYAIKERTEFDNYPEVQAEIIAKVLEGHAPLVAKVESGQINRAVLEMEIAKIVDRSELVTGRQEVIKNVINHMFGYGVLQIYLEDPDVTDLIGTRYNRFFVKVEGQIRSIPVCFQNERDFENYCKLIVIRNGGLLNENDNHARVADSNLKLRINAVIPPRSAQGAFLTIRKHREKLLTLEKLMQMGMVDERSFNQIKEIARSKSRFIICGKGAAGKTTLLRAMLHLLGETQRILVCEADTELYPESATIMVQKVLTRGNYGKSVSLNTLIKDGLTMSLDGYCIGEITGQEAWDFIKAGYTDHRVMGTLHSSGADEAVYRLLVLSEVTRMGINEEAALEMITHSLDFIIYLSEFKVMEIREFKNSEDRKKKLTSIYKRRGEDIDS